MATSLILTILWSPTTSLPPLPQLTCIKRPLATLGLTSGTNGTEYRGFCLVSFRIITYNFFYNFQVTIAATNKLLCFIGTQEFINEYGELFLILQKLDQDLSKAKCVEVHKMTAFVYGYNVNGYTTFQATKALANKQTNVYELEECMYVVFQ